MKKLFPVFFALIILSFGCKESNDNIILNGQEKNSNLNLFITDTLTTHFRTVKEDSLPGNNLSYGLLGTINDDIFGKSTASLYAQLKLLESISDFPNTKNADSAVLFIPSVDGLNNYGDPLSQHHLIIDRVTDDITSSNVYYQTSTFRTTSAERSHYYGKLINTFKDSMRYKKLKLKPYNGIRIKLSKELADFMMHLPKEAYKYPEEFWKAFKGIAIIPQDVNFAPGNGNFSVFDVNSTLTNDYRAKVILYYEDSNSVAFGFSGKTTTVSHGATGPYSNDIASQLTATKKSFNTTYSQALSGVKTKIEIPYLLNLMGDRNISINKAEIEFFVDKYSENFFVPPRMSLFQPYNKNSARNYYIDDALQLVSYGGVYDPIRKSYKFTITRHLQNIYNAKFFDKLDINNGLYLAVPSDQPVIGARAIFDHTKTKLTLVYTKAKN